MSAPIVIVGGGIAGLATALAAAPAPVLLLNRVRSGAGAASLLAQGGIAAPIGSGDTPQAHAHDTCEAGSHHNDRTAVDLLTGNAVAAIDWLRRYDVAFDRNGDGTLQLGREGGHDRPRIVHAGGDATGAKVMEALVTAARRATHIRRRAGVDVDGLLLRGGRVCGVHALDAEGNAEEIHGRAVVLATGGIGGLFARTSNPADADGNGLALALAAGAALRDLEFVQFHPTALALPGLHSLPLVTEALRGAGARLLDAEGKPLMAGAHPLADLAPRDLVARRVWQACHDGGAWLDARGIGAVFPARFPTVFGACMQHGIDPRLQPIPVTPAAHFHMGGIAVDADGRSMLPGLHAVGEVACNGVHGANRLASNSLLEGVVFGRRLGALLGALPDAGNMQGKCTLARRRPSLDAAGLAGLRKLMMQAMGPVRSGESLQAALLECGALAARGWQGALAQAMMEAALRRTQSLGAHFRIN
ncbi:L-aspartate oxidase [uncultured Stenotrophomonas sp.]|uniref:L-aspartate oxidase n=1 Tax=uncultured Stenotrophomonas sp. TaxID=165438 RepID=A0A1Y5Q3Z7_9GAMM|nr:L-aspartate oxidase [uncultured Stenotrophomonas sp.]